VSPSPSASPAASPAAASFANVGGEVVDSGTVLLREEDRGRLDADREGSLALVDTGDRALFLNAGSDDRVERRLEGGLFAEDRLVGREVLGDSHVGGVELRDEIAVLLGDQPATDRDVDEPLRLIRGEPVPIERQRDDELPSPNCSVARCLKGMATAASRLMSEWRGGDGGKPTEPRAGLGPGTGRLVADNCYHASE